MRLLILMFSCLLSVAFAQEVTDNPLRVVGTNFFDFTPLIQSFQRGEITNSPFLVIGTVLQPEKSSAQIVHNELRKQLSEEFKKEMLLAGTGEQLKMLYVTKVLEEWRKGTLSAGQFMSLDSEARRLVYEEIEREKEDYIQIGVVVTNLPSACLVRGKQVRIFALPTTSQISELSDVRFMPRYDYGRPFTGDVKDFTNKFFVTARGFVKEKVPKEKAVNKPDIAP